MSGGRIRCFPYAQMPKQSVLKARTFVAEKCWAETWQPFFSQQLSSSDSWENSLTFDPTRRGGGVVWHLLFESG